MNLKFTDEPNFDFSLKDDSQVLKDIPSFQNFPASEVGLKTDAYRKMIVWPENYTVNPPISGVYGS